MKNVAVRADVVYNGYQSKTVDTVKNKVNSVVSTASVIYKFG